MLTIVFPNSGTDHSQTADDSEALLENETEKSNSSSNQKTSLLTTIRTDFYGLFSRESLVHHQ